MDGNLLESILDKCEIYYGDCLISRENLLRSYSAFATKNCTVPHHNVSFSLHTGSICFDIIAIVSATLGGIVYDIPSNDEILSSLKIDDMVIYKNSRYRWKGHEEIFGNDYLVIEQDGSGRNGPSQLKMPYDKNKHLIKPYYGTSKRTDRRGVRRTSGNREEFLSYVLGIDITDVPVEIYSSIVVVCNRYEFAEISRNVRISYSDNKKIKLLEVAPAAYFTDRDNSYQFGENQTKTAPVIKVAGRIGVARDLVLDKRENRPIGMLVIRDDSLSIDETELSDLLRRKSLNFVHVTSTLKASDGETIFDLYEGSPVFACTREFLKTHSDKVKSANPLTNELANQVENIVENTVSTIDVSGGWDWGDYKQLRNSLLTINQSHWDDSEKREFLLSARALLNLFNSAVFDMDVLENAIEEQKINAFVMSPRERIDELKKLSLLPGSVREQCKAVTETLEKKYEEFRLVSPKGEKLKCYLEEHEGESIAVIVPKAFYSDVLYYAETIKKDQNVLVVTANKFDASKKYDAILVVGDISGKKFDPLQCFCSRKIDVILYECEGKSFSYKKNRTVRAERRLNGIIESDDYKKFSPIEEVDDEVEHTLMDAYEMDRYLDGLNDVDIQKLERGSGSGLKGTQTAEVLYIGRFVDGDQVLFSRYYTAVVFDQKAGTVKEVSADKLVSGDIIVFTKRDEYSKDIVDFVFEMLLELNLLDREIVSASKKAGYWKQVLKDYKETNNLSYRDLAKRLKHYGSSVHEVAIRQWLIDESRIIGPRDEKTLIEIAEMADDDELLRNHHEYFLACKIIRHERREILKLIAKAINDQLTGNYSLKDDVLGIVYENVEHLSETRELENIVLLPEAVNIPMALTNKPIGEIEV